MRETRRLLVQGSSFTLALSLALTPSASSQPNAPLMVGVQDLAWSHDGQAIFFSAMRVKRDYSDYTPEKWAVYRYHIASRTVTQLSSSSFSVAAAAREPLIIVAKLVNGNRDLYVLDENGREIGRLTSDPADDFAASWSPDGRLIAFTSRRGGHSEAYLTQRDGSNVRRLVAPSSDRTLSPTWSPDGRFIAYYREKGDGKDQIHVVLSDGSGDRNVTNDDFNNVYPGWTPDGRVVYGQGAKGARTNAVTVDTQGSEKRALLGIKSFFVRYAPDGSRVAYLEEHPESDGVRIVIARADGRVLDVVPLEAVRSPP